MNLLALGNVTISLGGGVVIDDVSLCVEPGEIVAILGPSGAGKTTLLRAITGFQGIDSGVMELDGVCVASATRCVSADQRKVTIVPQEHALFPHLSVAANIGYGVPKSQRRARVAEMVRITRLTGLEERMPHEISGGQQQRVALARALAPKPALVLLDEPFSGLDAGLRERVREETAQLLRRTGTTAVLVTHDQEEALSIADRVAVLREGRLVQCDSPSVVYRQPVDLHTAEFVGEANLCDMRVLDGEAHGMLGVFPCAVSVGGETGLPDDAERVGDGSTVRSLDCLVGMLRPEQLVFAPDGPVRATVDTVTYFGHDAMVFARLDSGETVRVRTQGRVVSRGAEIRLRVDGPPSYYDRTTGRRVG